VSRAQNTDSKGNKFTNALVNKIWEKGEYIEGHPPEIWRRDKYGNIMNRQEFGNRKCEKGWEIDHIIPVSKGGTDNIHNLIPVNWKVNDEKGDQYPWP